MFASLLLYTSYVTTRVLIGQSVEFWRAFFMAYAWDRSGGRSAGRTLSRRAGHVSLTALIDGVPPDVYFTSPGPGHDSTGDVIRHDTGREVCMCTRRGDRERTTSGMHLM